MTNGIVKRKTGRPLTTGLLVPPSRLEDVLRLLGLMGLTDEEMSHFFGVTESVFHRVIYSTPHLSDILSEAKSSPNRRVEASLYRRALGYQIREIHKIEGRPAKVVIKEMAADVLAAIFWLKNRDPKRWRDTMEVRHTLRDQMDRAHAALRIAGGVPAIDHTSTGGEEELES